VQAMLIVVVMLAIVAFIGEAAGLVYLRRLGVRIPRPKLARSTTIVMWGYLSCQMIAMLGGAVVFAMLPGMAATGVPLTPALPMAICGVGLGALVFGIWLLVLLFRYRAAFKLAAGQSQVSWGT